MKRRIRILAFNSRNVNLYIARLLSIILLLLHDSFVVVTYGDGTKSQSQCYNTFQAMGNVQHIFAIVRFKKAAASYDYVVFDTSYFTKEKALDKNKMPSISYG